jgi:hypothetical protein
MSLWRPCKRALFIKRLRQLDFEGPYSGTKHQFMIYEHHRLSIPSNSEYSIPQLKMMLKQVESIIGITITADFWESLS